MNTSFLRIKKAVAAFALGSLLATFAATPIALADSTPDWARGDDMGVGATQANRCEALAIALLNAGYESTEADAEAASNFEDIEGQCQQDVGLGVQLGAINAEGKTEYNGDALVQRTEYVLMITRLLEEEMNARILAGEEVADLSEAHTAELEASTHSGWDTKVFSTDAEGNEVELNMFQVWARSIHFDLIKGENNGEFLNPEGALNGYQASTVADRAAESFELTEEYSSSSSAESTDEEPDSEETTEEETTEEESTPEVEADGGDLTVSLSDNSPAAAVLYSGASSTLTPVVAVFSMSSEGEDTRIGGIDLEVFETTDGLVESIACYDENGTRYTEVESFDSDNEASLDLINDITIPAGEYVDCYLKGSLKASTSGDFSVQVTDVTGGNKASIELSSSVSEVAQHEVRTSDSIGQLVVSAGTSLPDVARGEMGVKVVDFELEASDEDLTITSLVLTNAGDANLGSDFDNLVLYIEDEMVAEGVILDDEYVTFTFDAMMLDEDIASYDAYVKADIRDGIGQSIDFTMGSLGVEGYTSTSVKAITLDASNFNNNNSAVSIDGGSISIIEEATPYDSYTKDRDDLIIAAFSIHADSGEDLELTQIKFNVADIGTGKIDLRDVLENFEIKTGSTLYGGSNNSTDLAVAGAVAVDHNTTVSTKANFDEDIDAGESLYVTLVADVKDDNAIDGVNLKTTISGIGNDLATAGIYITADDVKVSDYNVSAITFDTLEGELATADARVRAQSNVDRVVGTTVNAFHFELEAGSVAPVQFEEFVISATVKDNLNAGDNFDSEIVSNITLLRGEDALESLGSGSISNGTVTFNQFKFFELQPDEKTQMYVHVILADNESAADYTVKLTLDSVKATDQSDTGKNKTVTVAGPAFDSNRTITIKPSGSLSVSADTSNNLNNRSVLLPGGYTPTDDSKVFVGAFDFSASNETITVQDMKVNAYYRVLSDANVAVVDGHEATSKTKSDAAAGDLTFAGNNPNADLALITAVDGDEYAAMVIAGDAIQALLDNVDGDDNFAEADYTNAKTAVDTAQAAAVVAEAAHAAEVAGNNDAATVATLLAAFNVTAEDYKTSIASLNTIIQGLLDSFRTQNGEPLTLENIVNEVYVYTDPTGAPVASISPTSNYAEFENINIDIEDGESTIYLAVSTQTFGEDGVAQYVDFSGNNINGVVEEVQFAIDVTKAKGQGSKVTLSDSDVSESSYSNGLVVSPVDLAVEFVDSVGSTELSSSPGQDALVGILSVTAPNSSNEDFEGNRLETKLYDIALTYNTNLVLTNLTVKRVNGSQGTQTLNAAPGNADINGNGLSHTQTFAFDTILGQDAVIRAGETVYYELRATASLNADVDAESIKLQLNNVDSGFQHNSNAAAAFADDGDNNVIYTLRVSDNKIESSTVSE